MCLLVVVAAAWVVVQRRHPPIPDVATLGMMAPDIEELVRERLDRLRAEPRDAAEWGRFGMACEANGLAGAARDAYAAATSLAPAEAKWRYRLAWVENRLGRFDDAIRDVRRAIELEPTYAPAQVRLGLWLLDRNDPAGAERAFTRATELDPPDPSAWLGLSRLYIQQHEEQRAIGLLEPLLVRRPGDEYALQLLGTAYRRVGRAEEAESALAVGAAGEPAWTDSWTDEMIRMRRGYAARLRDATAYYEAGQKDAAISLLEQLARERPDDMILVSHLGEVYIDAHRPNDGIPLLERVVAREPGRFQAWANLAEGYLEREQLAKARTAIDRALSTNPTFGRGYETRGLILWRNGDLSAALDAFRDAVRYDPRNWRAFAWMGMVQMNLGRPADSLDSFVKVTRMQPARVDAWVGVANAAISLKDFDRATDALRRASQLNPDAPQVKETIARLKGSRG